MSTTRIGALLRSQWQMTLAGALAMGLPMLIGVALGRIDWGLTASLGGMVFLYLPPTPLYHRMLTLMACAFGLIAFIIEMAVVRHYAFTSIFITPLAILLAEAATLGQAPADELLQARMFDTLLGCLIGLLGSVCLHSPRFHATTGPWLRRMLGRQTPAEHRGDS